MMLLTTLDSSGGEALGLSWHVLELRTSSRLMSFGPELLAACSAISITYSTLNTPHSSNRTPHHIIPSYPIRRWSRAKTVKPTSPSASPSPPPLPPSPSFYSHHYPYLQATQNERPPPCGSRFESGISMHIRQMYLTGQLSFSCPLSSTTKKSKLVPKQPSPTWTKTMERESL